MWPSLVEFSEAIQNPFTCFSDIDLKSGITAVDRLGMPLVSSGQFAGVFKLRSSGRNQAIRCFIRELGDRAARYQAIDTHLNSCQNIPGINCLARFDYDADGIVVKGRKYPILIMEWIEGNTLDVYVEQVVGNKQAILYLANEFARLIKTLKEARIAHGDLQHGNIIVQSDLQLRLVDFDGMYVPEMNGMKACELGHIDYQHPARDINYFNCKLDDFSSIAIYLSLLALVHQPTLWKQFHGEGLLLRNRDFKNPRHSPIFSCVNSQNPELKRLLDMFRESCEESLDKVPSLLDLVKTEEKKRLPSWMIAPVGAAVVTKTREVKQEETQPAVTLPSQASNNTSQPSNIAQPSRTAGTVSSASFPFSSRQFFSSLWRWFWLWALVCIWVATAHGRLSLVWFSFCAVAWIITAFGSTIRSRTKPPVATAPASPRTGTVPGSSTGYPRASRQYPPGGSPASGPAVFVGSNIRFIYHRPNCAWALKISRRNKVNFNSIAEAKRLGYRSCRVCHP